MIVADWNYLPSPEAPSYGPGGVHGLEIGGGDHPRRLMFRQFDAIDWSDRLQMPIELHYDLGDARSLPYADGEFEHVFSSNLLEHFPMDETTAVLTEWARVLCIGGLLELVVPDFMGILRDYFSGENTWDHCAERIRGTRDYPGNEHFTPFTRTEFLDVIGQVPELESIWIRSSHAGGGIYSLSRKLTRRL